MAVIIPNSMSQCVLTFSALSPSGSTPTFTFGTNLSPTLDLANIIYTWWHDEYRPLQDTETTLLSIRVYNEILENGFPVNEAGTRNGVAASPNTSVLVQKRTGIPGRSQRGRMYPPHILPASAVNENGTIDGAKVTDIQACFNELVAALDTLTGSVMLFHGASSDATEVEGLVVSGLAATQRRRLRK